MRASDASDVVIVGGGIVGLTLAYSLAETRLSVMLIDKGGEPPGEEDCLPFSLRVSALTATNAASLARMGVWEGVSQACAFRTMEVRDAAGTGVVHYDAAELYHDALGYIVENPALIAALSRRTGAQENLRVVRQNGLRDMERLSGQPGDGWLVTLEDGETIKAGLLVGADGGRSRVRELAGLRTREWDYGQRAIVTSGQFSRDHEHCAWQNFLPSGPLALLPLPPAEEGRHDCMSMVWSCVPERCEALMALDNEGFARELEKASEERFGKVTALNRRYSFPLQQRHAVDYVSDGLALVGDAAHTIHPLAGQGVNLGLQDAMSLARIVAAHDARPERIGHLKVLSAYARERKGENLAMMALMEAFKQGFARDDLLLRWLRNSGLRWVDQHGLPRRWFMKRAMGL